MRAHFWHLIFQLQVGCYDSIKNVVTLIVFFIMFYQKCDFLVSDLHRVNGHLRSTLQSTEDQFLSVFTFIYFCPLFLQNYSLMFTYLDNVNFSIFISFYNIFFCTSNDQSIFFPSQHMKIVQTLSNQFVRISKCFHNFRMICNKTDHGEICKHTHTLLRILYQKFCYCGDLWIVLYYYFYIY